MSLSRFEISFVGFLNADFPGVRVNFSSIYLIESLPSIIRLVSSQSPSKGQPRAVVFHEKENRRHCHVVWSRIDTEAMKAIPMSPKTETQRVSERPLS